MGRLKDCLASVVVMLLCIPLISSCRRDDTAGKIITTTSVLSSIAEDISGDKIKVFTLVPAGSCPGHFDVKVHHLRLIEKSGMLLAHGFEGYLTDIRHSVGNPSFRPVTVQAEVSWLTLQGMTGLYQQVAKCLSEHFPEYKIHIDQGLERSLERINSMDREIQSIMKKRNFAGRSVICNSHLKDYLGYLGFEVVAAYARSEDLSPAQIRDVIRAGREKES